MARREQGSDDYLNLGQANRADEFALGEPISDLEDPVSEPPRALFILPIVTGGVLLAALLVGFFIFRAWDRTPIPEFDQREVRVIEPNSGAPLSSQSKSLAVKPATPLTPSPTGNNTTTNNSAAFNGANTGNGAAGSVTANGNNDALRPVSAILPELMPAIGMVVVRNAEGISSGSGFVVRNDGLFITNHHVIKGAIDIAVKLNNSTEINTVFVIKSDEEKDLAILKFKETGPFPVLKLEESQEPGLGEEVVVLGYPLGTKLGLDLTVSTGIVSSLRKYEELDLIQTNAAINHGNSGGPMINRRTGRVIGVITAKARDSESIGFAINVKELRKFLE